MDNVFLRQSGSALFIALIFLLLTTLIAVTIMDTQILSLKMVGNSQFREEAEQVNSGMLDETLDLVEGLLKNHDGLAYPDIVCLKTSTDPSCTFKNINVPDSMKNVAAGVAVDLRVIFYTPASVGIAKGQRMIDTGPVSANTRFTYYEVDSSYDGVAAGLSRNSMSVGIESRAQAPAASQQGGGEVTSTAKGGNYKFF